MSREVELIIKAKDEASKFVDSITESLKELTDVQGDVGRSAQKTGSLLEQLGKEFKDLNAEAKRLSSLNKVAEGLDRSATAVKNLESNVKSSATEFARLARESQVAAQAADRLRGALDSEEKSLKASNAARREASKELTAANRAVAQAERNQEAYNKAVANTPSQFIRPGARSAATFIGADLEETRATQARLTKEVAQYTADIERAKTAIEQLRPQVQAAAWQQAKLAGETEKASGALAKGKDSLERARAAYTGLRQSADQASTALAGMAITQEQVAKSSARAAAELARTKAQIEAMSKAPRARDTTDISSDTKEAAARRAAVERLRELRKEMASAQADAQRLNAAFRATATPTEQMGQAAGQAQVRVRDLKAELSDLRTRLRASEGGFLSWSQSAGQLRSATTGAAGAAGQLASASNSAANGIRPLGSAAQGAAQAMGSASTAGNGLRGVLNGIYGDSRKALSLMQRLRGEVLSLAAAYIGLQGAISNIGGVVKAFQTLEGAQSRLGSIFDQDTGRVTQELEWLQRQANRLGIEFGSLSEQYTKFAISADAANFTVGETRKVFLSVAEAGRVMKLSQDQLQGVFRALDQIISKGKVQAEELRGQIGDRMSGAFQIFAAAIGVSTEELDKMMKDGEVIANSSTLLKFAAELDKRFGSQLSESLRGTTAEIGRFSNSLFEAQLLVARGGFIESFTNALRRMNEFFASREGRDFFLSLGAALGRFIDLLAQVPKYFNEIVLAVQVFAAIKVAGVLTNIVASFKNATIAASGFANQLTLIGPPTQQMAQNQTALGRALASSVSQLAIWQSNLSRAGSGLRVVGATLGGLRTVVIGMTGLFRGLWLAIGGLPGLILTGVTVAIGQWMTSIDSATSALDEHQRQMQLVIGKYEEAKGKVTDWNKELKSLTITEVERSQKNLTDAFQAKIEELKNGANNVRSVLKMIDNTLGDTTELVKASDAENAKKLVDALDGLGTGTTKADLENLRTTLDQIAQTTTNDALKDIAGNLLEMLRAADEGGQSLESLAKAIGENENILKLMRGEITAAEAGLDKFNETVKETDESNQKATEQAKKFGEAMDALAKSVPALADELKKMETIKGLEEQYNQAIRFARSIGQANEAYKRFQAGVTATNFGDVGNDVAEAAANIIKRFEGAWQSSPFVDSDGKLRIGFSSDTITRADGSVQRGINQGDTVTLTDSIRDLNRRIGEMVNTIKGQIGEDRFNSFSPQQQGVLASLAYNYGDLNKTGILDTIKTGTVQEIADAIRSLAGHNGGINSGRRNQEATLFANGGDDFAAAQKQLEIETKRTEKAKEYNADLENRLSLQENENANAGRLTQEAFVQKRLEEEKKRAKEAGKTLDEAQIERIKAVAAAEYAVTQEKRDQKASVQEANVALQQAVALNQQRNALQQQFNAAQKAGDMTQATSLQEQLNGVNLKLQEAIEKARAMWEAIGGEQADVALTKLDTLKVKADTAGNSLTFLGLSTQQVAQLGQSFADGLVGVFDSFAQAIANGENAMQALGRAFLQFAADFLRQIAQMILKQMILNALQSFGIPGLGAAHTGGRVGAGFVGSGNARRGPAIGAQFIRYHSGGVAGLKPNEVPTVLEEGEEVLTKNDPRHRDNGGMAPGGQQAAAETPIRIVNVLNDEVAEQMMNSATGERVFLAHAKKNASTLRQLLG